MSATVLIAEDELLIAMDVMEELEAAGFQTIGPFARISQALEYCRDHLVDCAVLDVRLADGESYPLADLLAEREIPVVFHSGHAARGELTERYPRVRVCAKPSGESELSNVVAELCGLAH